MTELPYEGVGWLSRKTAGRVLTLPETFPSGQDYPVAR